MFLRSRVTGILPVYASMLRRSATKKSGSSKQWLKRHVSDPYVKASVAQDLRARSAFKLMEIQERYRLIKPSSTVVDLGASPGSWSEYVARLQKKQNVQHSRSVSDNEKPGSDAVPARLVAVDLLPMAEVRGCAFVLGDFTAIDTQRTVLRLCDGPVDVLLSDMLENTSGTAADHYRSVALGIEVLQFSDTALRAGGSCLLKYLQGADESELLQEARSRFGSVKMIKPAASRSRSREAYLLLRQKM